MSEWTDVAPAPSSSYHPNVSKFLGLLSNAEGAGYGTVVGGGSFGGFDQHPRVVGLRTADGPSTAAGRYQITKTTYDDVAPKLGIKDFSPASQDRIAIELIRRNGAYDDVVNGDFQSAMKKLGGVWASLPSSQYNQPKLTQAQFNNMANSSDDGWTTVAPAKSTKSDDGWTTIATKKQEGGSPSPAPAPAAAPAPVERKLTEETAAKDPQWVQNAKTLYQQFEGKPFKGSDAQASAYLKDKMSWYNNNLVSTGKTAYNVANFSDEGKKAFLQTVEDYDKMPTTWDSFGRGLVANIADPTNYAGLGLGSAVTKTVGKKAAAEAAKLTIQNALEKSAGKRLANAVTGQTTKVAAGGAALTGGRDLLEQEAQVNAGGQDEINLGQAAGKAALGGAGGAAVSGVINKVMGRSALAKFAKDAGDEAGLKAKAEIAQDLGKVADNPNMQGQPLQAIHANALEQGYVNDVQSNLKALGRSDLDKMGVDPKTLQEALQARKIITPEQLDKIRGNPAGDALADAIEKAQRTRAMTQAVNASTNPVARMGRAALDWLPVPQPIRHAGQAILGSRKTREQMIQEVLDNQKAAQTVTDVLGSSDATKSASTLETLAKNAQNAYAARQQVKQTVKQEAADAGEQLRIRNLQMGIRSNPKFVQGDIGGGTRGTLQYYGRLADSKELAKGLKIIEKTDPYLAPYIASIKQNKGVPNKDILLGLSDRLLKLRDDGILKAYTK